MRSPARTACDEGKLLWERLTCRTKQNFGWLAAHNQWLSVICQSAGFSGDQRIGLEARK
jgi:hypothetical protein